MEKEIEALSSQKIAIEKSFSENEITIDKIEELSKELQSIINQLEQKEERWLTLSMLLETD